MQKPSVRPVLSPRERPTGAPHSEREQNRFRSGTSGFSITAERGSGRGTSGTVTRPAPSRLRPDTPVDEPELRTETDRPEDADPAVARDSRPDTDRREVEEREEAREEASEVRALPSAPDPPPPIRPEPAGPFATTGARPQVSQYSSPPPMSS
ncbi:hypothetical protein GCM10010387_20140 [Streptomyces inusitatus]|uniref:Uncharacterized protein n=1 Tax=Streptomyces inusitatus TaxID=68221 RepID=A0A918PZQ6_9ACTN|nr:hypothetical protein GCM10010387_20140 [Streptomyces inusitatus]